MYIYIYSCHSLVFQPVIPFPWGHLLEAPWLGGSWLHIMMYPTLLVSCKWMQGHMTSGWSVIYIVSGSIGVCVCMCMIYIYIFFLGAISCSHMQSCVVYDFRDGYSFRSGGTFQLKIWKNRGDRAVVSKLMEEHEDGIENRIGLASMTKKTGGGNSKFFLFIFTPTWENDPIWLIYFNWVETTNLKRFQMTRRWLVSSWEADGNERNAYKLEEMMVWKREILSF